MTPLCTCVRERWHALRIQPDRALAVLLVLLALLAVVMGRPGPATLQGAALGQDAQPPVLDDDYVFED